MTLTISLMAGAALVIASDPTYASVGILAPIVLLLARLVQGFSAGGEFGSSSAFLVESAARSPARLRRVLAAGVGRRGHTHRLRCTGYRAHVAHWSDDALRTWGWRVAFGVGGLLGAGRSVAAGDA